MKFNMAKIIEKSLVIKKETIYDKIRNSLWALIFQKDFQMIQQLETLMKPKRPKEKIIIPREIKYKSDKKGKNYYEKY